MVNSKTLAVVVLASTAYSDDVLSHDDALSLLQTRVQKHVVNQEGAEEGTLADGSKLRLNPIGTMCADDEDITFTKCVEVSRRQIITSAPDVWGTSSLGVKRNLFSDGPLPRGCFLLGTTPYYNDQPIGNQRSETRSICQVGGGGGMTAFVAANGLSCRDNPDCKGRGYKRLDWNDALFVPEMTLGTAGGVCEEGCGLLTMEQCTKAGDMGLIDKITPGFKVREQPRHQMYGASHTMGTLPSGCSVMLGAGIALPYFNSWDTPMGATAGNGIAGPDGGAMVTASGVGSGWSQVTPICGVCTTTTTTTTTEAAAVESIIDEVAGECPDDQMVAYVEGRADNAEYRRDAQRQMVKFDTEGEAQGVCNAEEDCVGVWSDGRSWLGLYPGGRSWAKGVPNGSVKSVKLKSCVDMPVEEDEAAAVGDPHFVTNTGNRFDYS